MIERVEDAGDDGYTTTLEERDRITLRNTRLLMRRGDLQLLREWQQGWVAEAALHESTPAPASQ